MLPPERLLRRGKAYGPVGIWYAKKLVHGEFRIRNNCLESLDNGIAKGDSGYGAGSGETRQQRQQSQTFCKNEGHCM